MSDLLWEIGCEEIPARMVPEAIEQFQNNLMNALQQTRLVTEQTQILWCHATPRRLAIHAVKISSQQPDMSEQRRGPPIERAFDPQGRPTKAAEGFAKTCGVSIEALEQLSTPKGNYLAHTVQIPGSQTAEILPVIMNDILTNFPWPKAMRWGDGPMRFVRPVRWMVALLDGVIVPFTTQNGLTAGDLTFGHRFMAPGPFKVTHAEGYLNTLTQNRVVLSLEARKQLILEGVTRLATEAGGLALLDEDLITENGGLTEWPIPLLGRFDPKYLQIPWQVLATSMKYHQKYFPVKHADGTLMPCFIAIANLEVSDPAVLVRGYERVLRARLEDAAFYWHEDRKVPLPERLNTLQKVIFQARLGTLHKKALRMATLAGALTHFIQPDLSNDLATKAAILAKCDLTTGMVGEFPELQGIMGGYYALAAGEDASVATAIQEHYRPQGAGDALPQTPLGTTLSLADKLDTLTGCFGIGLAPTGTKDPLALRRAALGVIRMIIDGHGIRLPLLKIFKDAHAGFATDILDKTYTETSTALLEFFYGRLKVYLRRDFDYDLIDAVQVLGLDDLYDVVARIRALAHFKQQDSFLALVAANKRIANILNKAPEDGYQHPVESQKLQHPAEIKLFETVTQCGQQSATLIQSQDYIAALEILATLRQPIDHFFDELMVMDPDATIRRNRLALVRLIRETFGQIADISRLELPGENRSTE